ncbi:MAG TPA: M56 family metallopeptidase [Vicinamibacteria bacterium]|nr:M56 family metallopeptidase [Vicinamibacteria bacterium]
MSAWTLVAKVTLLLAAAAVPAALRLPRGSAARHFVWASALAGALALALVTPVAPRLTLAIPYVPAAPSNLVAGAAPGFTPTADEVAARRPASLRVAEPGGGRRFSWEGAWLVGSVAVLLWALAGYVGLARLARAAVPADAQWDALLGEALERTGVRRPVRLLRSAAAGGPVSWGWRRPVILLPLAADAWPLARRRAVLMHELAHVSRGDALTQLLATAAFAVYWFHPLVWLAMRRLRVESEHACDDRVLASGVPAADYAEELLAVAGQEGRLRLGGFVAVGMARPSHLEARVRAVLDDRRNRRAIPPPVRIAAAVALAGALVPLAGLRPQARAASPADSSFEREVPAAAGEVLVLDLETGGSVDLTGWDEPRVRVRARLGGRDWRETRVVVERTEGGVRVRSRQESSGGSSSTSHAFEIRVPRRFDLRLRSAGGAVTMAGLEGTFEGNTGGGALVLEHLTGRANLSTGGGQVEVADSDLEGQVSTGGGVVTLSRVRGGLRGGSGSGPVIDTGEAGSVVHIERAGGDVVLAAAPGGARVSTGGGRIHIGRAAGTVEATTGGGDVEVGPVAGSVKAGTGAGEVRVSLIDAAGAVQSVDITTGSGTVVVELPASLDARFDLETAFTRRFGRETRIDSDWPLARESTPDWDDRQGTPRRYVRARGVAGSGRGLVRVRAVNGDVVVRRGER